MEATLIHLSDLHFKNDAENRIRIRCLREDLARLTSAGPIHTLFTGDLVHAGDDKTYDCLFDELIGPLLEIGHEIAVVPGNHDIQRSLTSHEFSDQCLADRGSSYLFSDGGITVNPYGNNKNDPLANYHEFEEIFGPYDLRSYWGYLRTLGSISIVGLNSTWLSCVRNESNADRGRLRIEPYILDSLTANLPKESLKVAILHHPLDWLEETTRDAVTKLITSRVDIAFFGHVHTGDLANLAHGDSNCLFVQSPPLRSDWSKGTNGYAIIRCNIENKKFEIDYRSYSKTRREFVRGEDFATNGTRYPRPEDKQFFQASPSDLTLAQKFIDGGPFDFTDWHRNNLRAKTKRLGSFIMPKARRVPLDPEDQWLEPAEGIGDIVIGSSKDQFFVAPLDAGSTTAAFLVFKQLAESFSIHNRIPAFFDASEQKINRASILRAINRSSLVKYSHEEVTRLSETGLIVLVVDGLSLADTEQFNLFRETTHKYFPKIRLICFLSTEKRGFSIASDGSLNLHVDKDDIFEFSQLEVSDIRSMVSLWRPGISQDVLDATVSQVIDSFRQMDEPVFASSIAVVVETLSQDPEFKPLNKSRLLERYVECLLGRFELEDVREGTFASSDKIDLLSFVSRWLLQSSQLGLTDSDWSKICAMYQEQYLIELPKGLLEEFIEKGLLTLFDGKITFRGDYLFSFFIARQMKSDPDFAASLLAADGIFKYYREIVFYGELEGTDTRTVLNSVYLVTSEVEEILLENYSREGINLLDEWSSTCLDNADQGAKEAELADATERLGNVRPSPEHADRVSDNQLAQVQRRRGIALRTAVQEAEAKLLVAMRLYALLIKNALQLPADDKLRHLAKLYEAAELWVGFVCARRDEISTRPIVLAGGVTFINIGAAIDPEKSVREFKFNAPNSISRILAEAIRNPQLAVALRHVLPRLTAMGSLFARDALLELPGSENREAYIKNLLKESEVNLVTTSLRTLRARFLASGRSKELREHIENVVGTLEKASASIVGVDFARLKKARLVRDLKENARSMKPGAK